LRLIFGCIATEKNSGGDGHGGSNKSIANITTKKSALKDVREDYGDTLTSPEVSCAHLEACKEDTTIHKCIRKEPEGHVKLYSNTANFKPYFVVLRTHTKQVKECTHHTKKKFMSPTALIAGVNREQDDERTRLNKKDMMKKTVSYTGQASDTIKSKLEDWGTLDVATQKVLKTEKFKDHEGCVETDDGTADLKLHDAVLPTHTKRCRKHNQSRSMKTKDTPRAMSMSIGSDEEQDGSIKHATNVRARKPSLQDVREDHSDIPVSSKISCAHFEACKEDNTTSGSIGQMIKEKEEDGACTAGVRAKLTRVDRAEDHTLQNFEMIDDLDTEEQRIGAKDVKPMEQISAQLIHKDMLFFVRRVDAMIALVVRNAANERLVEGTTSGTERRFPGDIEITGVEPTAKESVVLQE